jgi:lysozyme
VISPMQISDDGKLFLEKCENEPLALGTIQVAHIYTDNGRQAIGFGCDLNPLQVSLYQAGITHDQAVDLMMQRLAPIEADINRWVTVSLSQAQYDALCSFCYNLGPGDLQGHTLLKLLNAGDYSAAANQFPLWDHELVNGVEVENPNLKIRRLKEQNLFLTGAY